MTTLDTYLNGQLNQDKIRMIVDTANQFQCYLIIEYQNKQYNAKSVLSLGVLNGTTGDIKLHATGSDCCEALEIIQNICEKLEKS
jgi:phosphotransferase system HPr-like phosphotransfer protein